MENNTIIDQETQEVNLTGDTGLPKIIAVFIKFYAMCLIRMRILIKMGVYGFILLKETNEKADTLFQSC